MNDEIALGLQFLTLVFEFHDELHVPGLDKLEKIRAIHKARRTVAVKSGLKRSAEPRGDVFPVGCHFELRRTDDIARFDDKVDPLPHQQACLLGKQDVKPRALLRNQARGSQEQQEKTDSQLAHQINCARAILQIGESQLL